MDRNFAVSDTEIGADGTVMVPFRCTSTGPDGNVAAGTITTITNPGSVAGITAVTNPAAFTGGRERETDEEFRDRYYASVDYAGGVNADSIRAALLQNVDGIMEAKVFENDTDDVDDYGLPPHSIEAVVYGGLDSDIAQIIYKELGAGIQTTGQKVIEVITASGATKAIHFNRPHPVPVYVKVVGLSTSGDFPHDGVDQLRAAIVAYILSKQNTKVAAVVCVAGFIQFGVNVFTTKRRYDRLAGISDKIDAILHGDEHLSFEQYREGELSVLSDEVEKLVIKLREQTERLQNDKIFLADSIADISHQIKTCLLYTSPSPRDA